MAELTATEPTVTSPDYVGLVRFLVEPLLDLPEVLRIDCEVHPHKPRVWIRLAFEGADKGRIYGRNGRTIQAIRTVLAAAGQAAGHTVHLEIFGEQKESLGGGAPPRRSAGAPPPRVRRPASD